MNKERRKQIDSARELLAQAREILETVRDDERDYYDNMPESLQSGEKGERADAAANALEEACSAFDDIGYNLDTASE